MLKFSVVVSCLCLVGCAMHATAPSPESRAKQATHLAHTVGWDEHTIHTDSFELKAYGSRVLHNSTNLTIYIEGDGLAWVASDSLSDNPTPITPTGLKMAINDQKNKPVAYLARPCQYVRNDQLKNCSPAYWSNLRFSPEVVNAMNQAVTDLKKYYGAKKITLIGYSGGGTIAALIAARRNDISKLITVAAVLEVKQWTKQENLTPLQGSLDPADEWQKLAAISQTHWVGGKDSIVPKEMTLDYADRFPLANKPKVKVMPSFDHACCWATDWTPA